MNDEQLTHRLQAASERIELSNDAQARHLEAIATALAGDDVIPLTPGRHRRLVASIVAAAVIAPAGLAAASDGSVPGDALYAVKRISERVIVMFDADVIARHRVEEMEALESAGEATPELIDRARVALAGLDENHPLRQRFAAAVGSDGGTTPEESAPLGDARSVDETPGDSAEREVGLPDGAVAVVTLDAGRIGDIDVPAGWAIVEIHEGGITVRSASHEVEIELLDDGSLEWTATGVDGADDSASEVGEPDDEAHDDSPASPADADPDDDDSGDDDSTDD